MAVTFDAVGPAGGAGATSSSSTTLSWTHTVGAGVSASNVVLVFVNVDGSSTAGLTCAVTYAGAAMTSLHAAETTTAGADQGYIQGFSKSGVATGAATVTVTVSGGTPADINAGSLSFDGVTGLGTAVVANADSTPSITVSTATANGMVAGAIAAGGSITGVSGAATSRFIRNTSTTWSTGAIGGATAPGTGSNVTLTWADSSSTSDCLVAVEVQGAVTGTPIGLASATGTAQTAGTSPHSVLAGPAYAGTATDLGGVYGSWATTQFATGGP
jgi:hypothetical protein